MKYHFPPTSAHMDEEHSQTVDQSITHHQNPLLTCSEILEGLSCFVAIQYAYLSIKDAKDLIKYEQQRKWLNDRRDNR